MNENDYCPVSEALDFFSRKWVFCILMDMFNGCKHFTDFQQYNPNISNNVLSQTLKYMEDMELIKKEYSQMKTRNKTEYTLTEKGLKANRILYELTIFSLEELNSPKLDENAKNEIINRQSQILGIN